MVDAPDFSGQDFGPDYPRGSLPHDGPYSDGWADGFGPLGAYQTRNDTSLMALLGTVQLGNAPGFKLFWDFSNTECFYLLDTSTDPTSLYRVSPNYANLFFGAQGTTIYNPFFYNPTNKPSTLI